MKKFMLRASTLRITLSLVALVLLPALQGANAQSFCASDGQPQPVQLFERFINADCESCWGDASTPRARTGQLALDWVLPGSRGDDAPLSAVASREGLDRLLALGQDVSAAATTSTRHVTGLRGATLRVAHGLALANYMGVSIALTPIPALAKKQRWTAWLALVEALPVGMEGSPVARNLVRNVIQTHWDGRRKLLKTEQNRFFESRAMSVAQGADPSRLRVVGWVENEKGQVMAAAQSQCKSP